MAKNSHFQFGIGRLIILMSAVAVVMAITVRLDAPQVAQWVFAGYLAFFVGWAVMSGPNMYAKLAEAREQRRMLQQRRSELESETAELRRISKIANSDVDTSSLP
jgi:hypothetical protein